MIEQTTPPAGDDAASAAADTVGANLLQALVDCLDRVPAWRAVEKFEQERAVNEIRARVQLEVRRALAVVFAGDYPACAATLTGVSFADGIAAKLRIDKTAAHRHELADATGQTVLVVMASAEEHFERMEAIRARAAQGDLFGDAAADGGALTADQLEHAAKLAEAEKLAGAPMEYYGLVGEGEPSDDLVAALRRAGLEVTFNDTARWSAADRAQARAWADDQNSPDKETGFTVIAPPCVAVLIETTLDPAGR